MAGKDVLAHVVGRASRVPECLCWKNSRCILAPRAIWARFAPIAGAIAAFDGNDLMVWACGPDIGNLRFGILHGFPLASAC